MNTIFMNSKNSKTSDPHRLLLNLTDKIDWKGSDKYVALSNLRIYQKSDTKTINLKYKLQRGMKNLYYLVDRILYQIFKIILSIFEKTWRKH